MLVSPEFAGWIVDGVDPGGGPQDSRLQSERFAEHERTVMSRTNGLHAADGSLNLPWPHSLGTPPWGAQKELENGAASQGAAYAMRVLGFGSGTALRQAHGELVGLVRDGLPGVLYIGNRWMPRHVTLVLPGDGPDRDSPDGDTNGGGPEGVLNVYDPATGSVTSLDPERFATRTLGIAGWNVPWITVHPH
jgi:hypothetical protein